MARTKKDYSLPDDILYQTPVYIHSHETHWLIEDSIVLQDINMVIQNLNSFYQTSINHVNQVALSLTAATAKVKEPYKQYLTNLQKNDDYQEFTKAFIKLRADIENYKKDNKKAMDDQRFLNKATMDRIENSLIKAATREYKQTWVKVLNRNLGNELGSKFYKYLKNAENLHAGDFAKTKAGLLTETMSAKEFMDLVNKGSLSEGDLTSFSKTFQKIIKGFVKTTGTKDEIMKKIQDFDQEMENFFRSRADFMNSLTEPQKGDWSAINHHINRLKEYDLSTIATSTTGFLKEKMSFLFMLASPSLKVESDNAISEVQLEGYSAATETTDISFKMVNELIGKTLKASYVEGQTDLFHKPSKAFFIGKRMSQKDGASKKDLVLHDDLMQYLNDPYNIKSLSYYLANYYALSTFTAVEPFDGKKSVLKKEGDHYIVDETAYQAVTGTGEIPEAILQLQMSVGLLGMLKGLLGTAFPFKDFNKVINLYKNQGLPLILEFIDKQYWTCDILNAILHDATQNFATLTQYIGQTETEFKSLLTEINSKNLSDLFILKKTIRSSLKGNRYDDFYSKTVRPSYARSNLTAYSSVTELLSLMTSSLDSDSIISIITQPMKFKVNISNLASPIVDFIWKK